MNSSSLSAARTPFIRLLVPLLAGILYQEFLCPSIWGNLIPALCGFVLLSSFIKRDSIEEQYHKRRIFGVGLFLIVFSIGAILHGTQNRISQQPSGFYPIAIAHVNVTLLRYAGGTPIQTLKLSFSFLLFLIILRQ